MMMIGFGWLGGLGGAAVIGEKIEAIASTWPSHATLAYAADCPPSLLFGPKIEEPLRGEKKNK